MFTRRSRIQGKYRIADNTQIWSKCYQSRVIFVIFEVVCRSRKAMPRVVGG
jgi:hypothetical protein